MAAGKLRLYDLLAPQFFAGGIPFPDYINRYLSFLDVDELHSVSDESGVVYWGQVSFRDEVGPEARKHHDASGAVFRWEDVTLDFRLTVPRDGAQFIDDAAKDIAVATPADSAADDLEVLFTALGPVEFTAGNGTEFPGIRFRLELLLTALTLHLPKPPQDGQSDEKKGWLPGKMGPDFRIVPDSDLAGQDVKFILPKAVFEYEQGDDFNTAPTFRLKSWGDSGFDAPADLEEGELVRMEPPIALHQSGRYAFGIEQIAVDFSPDHTPPEILQFFGTDESFEGFYIKSARFFYSDGDKDFAFNAVVNDLLVSFTWEISFELEVDFLFEIPLTLTGFSVETKLINGQKEIQYTHGTATDSSQPRVLTNGRATVPQSAVVQFEIHGGIPDYNISVKLNDEEIYDATRREARISPGMPGTLRDPGDFTLVVTVSDSAKTPNTFSQTIALTVTPAPTQLPAGSEDGAPADRPRDSSNRPNAEFTRNSADLALPTGYDVSSNPAATGITETIAISSPPSLTPHVTVNGADRPVVGGRVTIDVPEGSDASPIQIVVTFPAIPAPTPQTFPLFFDRNRPKDSADVAKHITDDPSNQPSPLDQEFRNSGGRTALRNFVTSNHFSSVTLQAFASFQQETRESEDTELSKRRRSVVTGILNGTGVSISTSAATGFHGRPSGATDDPTDQVVIVTGNFPATSEHVVHATIKRALGTPPPPPPPGDPIIPDPPNAPVPPTHRPPIWKRLSLRTRFERNQPVLGEISGTIDFDTKAEEDLRKAMRDAGKTVSDDDRLQLQQTPAASSDPRPQDGVVDFKLNVTYDSSTHQLTETLSFGDTRDEVNGLLRMDNPLSPDGVPSTLNRLKDTFGALLVFTPVINSAAAALDPSSAGDWAVLAVSLGVPVGIGALDIFRTKSITLFSGTGVFRQMLPTGTDPLKFTDFGVVFDYRVEFEIHVDQLHIHSTKPLKVRYNAVGFNAHINDGEAFYQPIFDTSKGYEIDLSDPGLLNLPDPLGDVLKIAAARIARFNPLTLEADLALKTDLGVITVDRFKIKVPLDDPPGAPMILPSGIKVNIPAAIIGSGYVNIRASGGVEGALDVTIIPAKLRIAASVGVDSITDPATQRKAVAVFAGLVAEFPTPLILGSTGLGIYGFSGLFAMNYKRNETPPAPGDSVAPALRWLERAHGDPTLIERLGDQLWVPEFDRWSFGIGVILGTVEGGFLMNFRGMFVLELPGPRILILVKVQIIQPLPGLGDGNLTVGILGAIDIDFNLGQITIGVIIDAEIKELVKIRLPVEIFFKINQPRNWHLYMGTIAQPASAEVLNLVRAHGYLMIDGDKIDGFPSGNGTVTLPGIAVATGIEAAIILGDEDVGLYLRVAAEAHLGIAFSPFFIAGDIKLTGKLHLFVVSIEADGLLHVEAPDPTIIHGEICGHVSFFFFSVGGCVGLTTGEGTHVLPAPPLVRNVYLQSHAPVLTAGQGTDRPIDASLGDAVMLTPGGSVPTGAEIPSVPIDSVPVIQFQAAPRVTDGTTSTTTFTEPLVFPPNLTPDGFINVGGGRKVRYLFKEIALNPPLPGSPVPRPPATWRTEQAPTPQGVDTNVDLALFSREPVTATHALERSSELQGQVTQRWDGLCMPVAPPVCVLWTFCRQPLGPSGHGWHLNGIPQADPPGTQRHGPPPTDLFVEEPVPDDADALLDLLFADASLPFEIPAQVLGINPNTQLVQPPLPPAKTCIDFRKAKVGTTKNPSVFQKTTFLVRNAAGKAPPQLQVRKVGAFTGLDCSFTLEITLPVSASSVDLVLVHFAVPGTVEAINENGSPAAKATMTAAKGKAQTLTFKGKAIRRVIVRTKKDQTLLLRVCFEPISQPPGQQNFGCFRALQLPRTQSRKLQHPLKLPPELEKKAKKRPGNQWIILHTGLAKRVRLFIALARELSVRTLIVQLDEKGTVLEAKPINQLFATVVTGISTGLPAEWIEPTGPWDDQVIPAATLVAGDRFRQLERLFITLTPNEKCTRIQIMVAGSAPNVDGPQALLIAVEVCSKAEQDRAAEGEQIQTGQITTVTGYLNGGDIVPLLQPNQTYTLTLRYDAESVAADGSTSTESDLHQSFRFRTDAHEPARLDPYVLGTTPDHEARFHFYEDAVNVVFNDVAVIQLFSAYGKTLRAVLRAADGVPNEPDEITTLDPVAGEFSTPYRDFLIALIEAGLLPCVGEITTQVHGSYTMPITLRSLMGYTLDIELVPPNAAPSDAPLVPLYRRSFATSKFASLTALVDDLKASNIRHRPLNALISGLSTGAPVVVATDEDIQNAFLAAGEQALPAPSETGITIYWAQRPGATEFSPHIILIDAAEPLWRTRNEPGLETVPDQDDPAFKRIVPQNAPALEIIEQFVGSGNIARFVHSPSGTRTLAITIDTFSPSLDGVTITLAAHRLPSALYGMTEQTVELASIKLQKAPWEEDET